MIALLDEIAFAEAHVCELARHLRPHADRRVRFDIADAVDFDRDVALCDVGDDQRDRAAFAAAAPRGRSGRPAAGRQAWQQPDQPEEPKPATPNGRAVHERFTTKGTPARICGPEGPHYTPAVVQAFRPAWAECDNYQAYGSRAAGIYD